MKTNHALLPPDFPESWAESFGQDDYGLWQGVYIHDIEVRFRWIPPGEFMMGSPKDESERDEDEGPRHRVRFAQGFWLAETACTQALWQAVMGQNPSRFGDAGPEHPVENVSWDDTQDFIVQINTAHPGLELRLPAEAEWEYACRAGTVTRYWFGDTIDPERANYEKKNEGTVPVRRYPHNRWGLNQVHGNVWEWCQDRWHGSYAGAPEAGEAWTDGVSESRVLRGGSWGNEGGSLRSAGRSLGRRGDAVIIGDRGFRLVRGPELQSGQPGREKP